MWSWVPLEYPVTGCFLSLSLCPEGSGEDGIVRFCSEGENVRMKYTHYEAGSAAMILHRGPPQPWPLWVFLPVVTHFYPMKTHTHTRKGGNFGGFHPLPRSLIWSMWPHLRLRFSAYRLIIFPFLMKAAHEGSTLNFQRELCHLSFRRLHCFTSFEFLSPPTPFFFLFRSPPFPYLLLNMSHLVHMFIHFVDVYVRRMNGPPLGGLKPLRYTAASFLPPLPLPLPLVASTPMYTYFMLLMWL